jgi:xanthine dehydrogenase accessory factor
MTDLWDHLDNLRRTERRVAMATLIATRGTTPKKEGAKMWVGEGGRILGSVTIGGCVDARVIAESEAALAAGAPRRLEVALGDEEAWDLGLTCSGVVEVLVEPVELMDPAAPVVLGYDAVRAEAEAGRAAVAVTPLDGGGTRLVVREDGSWLGSLGNPALDGAAAAQALDLLARRTSRTAMVEAAGASVEAFFEVHAPPSAMVVFGATAVAVPLVELARTLGFRTTVVDARPRFASAERFPRADEVRVGIPSQIAESLPLGPSTSVVLLAHDYKYDVPVLRQVLQRDAGYVGLLGSRRRGRAVLDFLREEGVPEEQLGRIHVPVGLDIGAESAAEIALSILAEAIAARGGRRGGPMRERGAP